MIFPKFPKLLSPKKFLGIDIGTAAVKMVELSGRGERKKLESYGEMKTEVIHKKPFWTSEKTTFLLSNQEISRVIKAIKEEAKINTRQAIFSIPDFSSFFTNLDLPPMSKEELSQAVVYEARQHIPLPLKEVTLDWQLIEGKVSRQEKTRLKVLLVAVPNEVVNQYREIGQLTNLEVLALEAEVFSLCRSLIPANEKRTLSIIDIGAHTTTCSIIDKKVLKTSHSFDLSGRDLTEAVAKSLSIDYKTAQNLKEKYGLKNIFLPYPYVDISSPGKSVRKILLPLIDSILSEIEKIRDQFYQTESKEIEKFILAGGTAFLPELREYFEDHLKKEVEIADPFSNIFYPPILEKTLKQIGPSYAVAVGAALRGFQ